MTGEAGTAEKWRLRGRATGLLFGLIILVMLGMIFPAQILWLLLTGWASYLRRVLPQFALNGEALAIATTCLVMLAWGGHRFAGWLYGAWGTEAARATRPPWRARWTATGLALLLLMFVASIATVAVVHQTIWLARSPLAQTIGFDRGWQQRTMSDLRSIGTAIEAYRADYGQLPAVPSGAVADLAPYLAPTFLQELPAHDGWSHPLAWIGGPSGDRYSLVSPGKDGLRDRPLHLGATTTYDADIYFSGGEFTVFPEGTQN